MFTHPSKSGFPKSSKLHSDLEFMSETLKSRMFEEMKSSFGRRGGPSVNHVFLGMRVDHHACGMVSSGGKKHSLT